MKLFIPDFCRVTVLLVGSILSMHAQIPAPPGNPVEVFEQDFTQIPVPVFADYAERFNGGRVGDLWANIQYHKSQLLPDPAGHLMSVDVGGATSQGSDHNYNFRSEYRELDITTYPARGTTQRYVVNFSVVDMPEIHAPLTIFQRFNRNGDGPDLNVELTGVHQFSNAISGDIQIIAWDGRIRTGKFLADRNDLVVEVYNHESLGRYRVTLNGELVHEMENLNTMPSTQGTWWQFGLYWHGIQDATLRTYQNASGNTRVAIVAHYAQKASYDYMAIAELPDNPFEPIPCVPPADWNRQDIGATNLAGNACQEENLYFVEGSGADIWNTADAFHYVHKTLNGDGAIYAKVTHLDPTDPWAKAGVMMRESGYPGARNVFIGLTAGRGVTFQRRLNTDALTTSTRSPSTLTTPFWVKLVRVRNTFSGYHSPDGVNWKLLDSVNVVMPLDIQLGMAVTSHNNSTTASAVFEPVIVEKYLELNNPPVFSLTGGMQVEEDFTDSLELVAELAPMPQMEASEVVTYSISPSEVDFVEVSLDTLEGKVVFRPKPQANGSQQFTLTANDGRPDNHSYSHSFTFQVKPVNDAPAFQLSATDLSIDPTNPGIIEVIPDSIPPDEQTQLVSYRLEPAEVDFADIQLDTLTGTVMILPYPETTGIQEFRLIANDHQAEHNLYEQTFRVEVLGANSFTNVGDPTRDPTLDPEVQLFPNPTVKNPRLIIENEWEGIFNVDIYDGFGKLYRTFTFEKLQRVAKYVLQVKDFSPGLYVVSVRGKATQHALKLWLLP